MRTRSSPTRKVKAKTPSSTGTIDEAFQDPRAATRAAIHGISCPFWVDFGDDK
jgi:hypothetical protein